MKNNQEIKPKGLTECLDEDPSLKRIITYEEFNHRAKTTVDDSGLKTAYKNYCKVINRTAKK